MCHLRIFVLFLLLLHQSSSYFVPQSANCPNPGRAITTTMYSNNDMPNFCELSSLRSVKHLQTRIRDERTSPVDFARYAKRLMTIICEESMALSYGEKTSVTTPLSQSYLGEMVDESNFVAVSIIRAADAMLDVFLNVCPQAVVGKILIQRDEETHMPKLYYSKVPSLEGKNVILLDPMLATGGSALEAIKVLIEKGADANKIIFVNVVASPEGVKKIHEAYPSVRIVAGELDQGLNEKKYIVPGLGDFGDRFFGTV